MAEYADIQTLSYKQASDELETIVRELEQGDLELEDSLSRYARGVDLLKSLKTRLSEAEQKVQVLLDAASEVEVPVQDVQAAPSDLPF